MEQDTLDRLETEKQLDELELDRKHLRFQLDFANQELRMLRVQCARYERVIGLQERRAA